MDPDLEIAQHVRSTGDAEGTVLLDLRSGKYLALNGVGSILWEALATGASRRLALERLAERFPDVPAHRLEHDVEALLSELQARGLLHPRHSADRRPDLSRGPADSTAAPGEAGPPFAVPPTDGSHLGASRGLALRFAAAYLGLLVADAVLRVLGFARFHALVRRFPIQPAARPQPYRARRIVESVDRASAFYFKRAWCLQRSAVTVALLRLAGFPARLVIGVQRRPFGGHAWVEMNGRVVNDRPAVQREFEVLETC